MFLGDVLHTFRLHFPLQLTTFPKEFFTCIKILKPSNQTKCEQDLKVTFGVEVLLFSGEEQSLQEVFGGFLIQSWRNERFGLDLLAYYESLKKFRNSKSVMIDSKSLIYDI
jgi:hypothetical protein